MRLLRSAAFLVAFTALLVVGKTTSHLSPGPHVTDVNILLPPKMTRPVEYRLQGSDGCFKWSWDHHDILSVIPEYNASNSQCSTSARLRSIAPFTGRKETAIYAADVHTGIVIRCKVFIDNISRIQIFHNSIKLDLDGLATLRARALIVKKLCHLNLPHLFWSSLVLPFVIHSKVIRGNILQVVALPSPHHRWSVLNSSVAEVDHMSGFAQALSLGVTSVIVEDTRVAGHMQVSSLNVVLPDTLCLYIMPLSDSGDPVDGLKATPSLARWFVVSGRQYLIQMKVFLGDLMRKKSILQRGKSALVFCSTRKGAQEAALKLSQTAITFGYSNPFIKEKEQQERLREASLSCSDKQLQSYILYGVGYHNGGLCLKDRSLIEGLFLKGDIKILCTTNTLAHGINLPAHTVVIKSTQHFNKEKGLYMEYDRSTILQMCGRAGRPPFDDTGMVIIMTRRETVHLYENLLNGCEMVESQLLSCVTEHLTAEIVQLTVSDIARAIEWMKFSYLSETLMNFQNPEHYAVKKGISRDRIEKHMQEITVQKVNELSHHQMIWTDKDGFLLNLDGLMTRYYLKFNTMSICTLMFICHAEEIAWIQLRRNEKKLLNDINIDKDCRIRFHINGDKQKRKKRIQTREEKIFVLANDCLTGDPSVHDLSLTQDMNSICSIGCRISKCMKEYFIFKKNYKGAINSTLLAKSLYQKLWDDSPYLLKQLPGIGMVTAKALHSMGIKSFDTLAEADPRRIEIVTSLNMSIEENECHRRGMSKFVVTLTRISEPLQSTKRHYADMIVATEEDNLIHFHEKIRVDEFSSPYCATILLSIPQQQKLTLKADLILKNTSFNVHSVGLDFHQKLVLLKESNPETNKHRCKHPSLFPPPGVVCVIEDESEMTSCGPAETLCNMTKSKTINNSMPSFKLIDEDLELGEEGEPGFEIQNDSCKIISEQTIFEHIRVKAKNFPLLTTSSNVCSPSSEAMLLTRKRPRDKAIELDSAQNVMEETEGSKISLALLNVISEQGEREQYGHDSNKLLTPKHHTTPGRFVADLVDVSGGSPCKSETSGLNGLTQDTIFDHIKKKAQYFPALSRTMQFDSIVGTKEHSFGNQPDLCIAASHVLNTDKSTRDTIIISDSETRTGLDAYSARPGLKATDDKFSRSPHGESGSWSAPPTKVSCINTDPASIEMRAFDISMMKHNNRVADSRNSKAHGRRKQYSPNGSKRHWCSLEMAGKNREVDSFLGFTSVFSFL
ncbi:ATP-dependent DNA helicase [Salix suchowensis]|nr:ATP-dependent DNA helicase [Salix suchowensis]